MTDNPRDLSQSNTLARDNDIVSNQPFHCSGSEDSASTSRAPYDVMRSSVAMLPNSSPVEQPNDQSGQNTSRMMENLLLTTPDAHPAGAESLINHFESVNDNTNTFDLLHIENSGSLSHGAVPFNLPLDLSSFCDGAVQGWQGAQADELLTPRYQSAMNPPKIGARFSRESSKLLSQWYFYNLDYPYPSKEDMKTLQCQTGLSPAQIKNWLANTRRRRKGREPPRDLLKTVATSQSSVPPTAIPIRPGTPAVKTGSHYRDMNPLQRWFESPPEHEPAMVADIAGAMEFPTSRQEWLDPHLLTDESGWLFNESPTYSQDTSGSSSFASGYSHSSGSSITNMLSGSRKTRKRRKKRVRTKLAGCLLSNRHLPFQCTFCAETFKTKYDWQRHEKTFHISLERWLCTPNGPRAINPENNILSCVFCGDNEPTDEHIRSHNPKSCQERVFHRKDHLKQHLHLVHRSKLEKWTEESWRAPTPIIKSRCGFCGITLDSWVDRVEHIADHFKMGKSMADWTGDWGFDDIVSEKLENAIPPYLIHGELTSTIPFEASTASPESPRHAYELIRLELSYFVECFEFRHGHKPDSMTIQLEACRIIIASEVHFLEDCPIAGSSWLRDLIMFDEDIAVQAQFLPLRTPSEGRLRSLEILGQKTLFAECPLESRLHQLILVAQGGNMRNISNTDLQAAACAIITQIHTSLKLPLTDFVFHWMIVLARSSTAWLDQVRQRACLPGNALDIAHAFCAFSTDTCTPTVPGTKTCQMGVIGGYQGLSNPENDYPRGLATSGPNLGRAATDSHDADTLSLSRLICAHLSQSEELEFKDGQIYDPISASDSAQEPSRAPVYATPAFADSVSTEQSTATKYHFHDPNFQKWLSLELSRWVSAVMSSHNPRRRIPSDAEIQRQARSLLYNNDDPWDQTVADNPEWLHRFKLEVGIAGKGQLNGSEL